jgi:hypothetical protein
VVLYRLTAANGLGLTDAVPNRRTHRWPNAAYHLRNLTLDFQAAAQSRLGWAGHPAMRFPQALHSLRDMLSSGHGTLHRRLISILKDPILGWPFRTTAQRYVGLAGADASN